MTEQWKKEVDDALAVMGGLQARQGRVLKDHSEWLQTHDRAMARIEASIRRAVPRRLTRNGAGPLDGCRRLRRLPCASTRPWRSPASRCARR